MPRVPPAATASGSADGRPGHGERPGVVFEHLRSSIVLGQLTPGTPLVEVEIAARLGVSRTPVRDALNRLHNDGLIVSTKQRPFKFSVAALTRDDAHSLYRIVAELDGLAAYDAARAPAAVRRELAQTLRKLNEDLSAAAKSERQPHGRIYELDAIFHHSYVAIGATPRLLALHASIKPQVERYARMYALLLADEISSSVAEHQAIIGALARGDADAAQNAARRNWQNAAERLARAIADRGEWGKW
jgi:DNA-binding GntR family transcriptional regulator